MNRTQVLTRYVAFGAFCAWAGQMAAAPNPNQPVPTPEWVQARLWRTMELQDFRLEGVLRTSKSLHPLVMRTKGREMVYEFTERPLQIRVTMTPDGSRIERRAKASDPWREVEGAARLERILDSDLNYEDLGLDFIRWGDARPLGTDRIKTLAAWAYEANPPGKSSYARARFWISSEFMAVLRVDAMNERNQVIKRVEVNGVQQVGDHYVIKEMQISSLIPGRELSSSRTYIEIRRAEKGSGL
ncbi:MAG: outer membrane lipoprotein-sorting protein [Verrucomicrobiia bacterium]